MITTKTAEELWDSVLQSLKPDLKDETFDLWLKPLSLAREDNGSFVLRVPNRFFSDWVKSNFQKRIEDFLGQATDMPARLRFEIQSDERVATQVEVTRPNADRRVDVRAPRFNDEGFRADARYEFDTFVVGPSNRFAEAAAEAVARDPGGAYNPLFIYGGVGLGKTHLLHSIGHEIQKNNPKATVVYVPSERFINEFIDALRFEKMKDFRMKYRSVDCLLIDDIQFLMGKDSSQEEFFYTFNSLYDSRKQIVICSDRPPKETLVGDRLVSRFEWGVIADIQPPTLETRIAILRKKIEEANLSVPDDVVLFVASHIKTNIRELEGSITRVMAYATLTAEPLTVDTARKVLRDTLGAPEHAMPISIDHVQRVVARHFNLDPRDMKSKRRTDAIAFPRQIAMHLVRTLTELSTIEIGAGFGGKDHTTVMHACNKIKAKLSSDPYFVALLNKITQDIREEALLDSAQ